MDYSKLSDEELLQAAGLAPKGGLNPMFGNLIRQESGGNVNAVSPKGAAGIAQIMPATARDPGFGVRPLQGWDGQNPATAPVQEQIRFGNDYLNAMQSRYGGNKVKAAAAYNAGPGAVDAAKTMASLPQETQNYVTKVVPTAYQSEQPATDYSKMTDAELLAQAGLNQPSPTIQDGTVTPPNGLFDRIGAAWSDRAANPPVIPRQATGEPTFQGKLRGAGQKAGYAVDVLNSGINYLADNAPQEVKNVTGKVGNYLGDSVFGDAVLSGGEKAGQLAAKYPETAANLTAVGNLASLIPAAKIAKPLAIPVVRAGEGIAEGTSNRFIGAFARKGDDLDKASTALHAEAKPFYQAVENQGGKFNTNGVANIEKSIAAKIGDEDELLDGPAIKLYAKMRQSMQNGISVTKLDKYRRRFSAIAEDTRKSKIDGGGLTEEGRLAVNFVKGIDDAFGGMKVQDFSQGTPAIIDTLNQARAASARAQSFDRIARLIKKTEGDPRRTKAALTKLLSEKSNPNGLKTNETAALENAAKTGLGEYIERGLGTFGIDFGTRKNVALPGLGLFGAGAGAAAGVTAPGVIPAVAAGTIARQTGKFASRGKLEKALKTIEKRPLSPTNASGLAQSPLGRAAVANPNISLTQLLAMPPSQAMAFLGLNQSYLGNP